MLKDGANGVVAAAKSTAAKKIARSPSKSKPVASKVCLYQIKIIIQQFIRRRNMSGVTTRVPYNVKCQHSGLLTDTSAVRML